MRPSTSPHRRSLWPRALAAALAAAACTPGNDAPAPCPAPRVSQEGWRSVERYPLAYRLPAGFGDLESVSSDQWSRRYVSPPAFIHVDFGDYAPSLDHLPGGVEVRGRCRESIGGTEALVMTGRRERPDPAGNVYWAAATWPDVANGGRLTLWAETPDVPRMEALLAAFRTVRFLPVPPPPSPAPAP
jgi:hypothetical protein